MKNTVGLNQGALMQARMEEFLTECSRTGISQVELRVPKLVEALYHMSPVEMRKRLDDNGVTVTALNSMDDFALVPDENLPLLRREAENAVHLCSVVDCDLVVAPVGRWFAEPYPSAEEVIQLSARRLQFIADILEPAGIRIGVEPIAFPHFTIWDLEQSVAVIDTQGRCT
jgi:sugar phosphate isomerase/epimerase